MTLCCSCARNFIHRRKSGEKKTSWYESITTLNPMPRRVPGTGTREDGPMAGFFTPQKLRIHRAKGKMNARENGIKMDVMLQFWAVLCSFTSSFFFFLQFISVTQTFTLYETKDDLFIYLDVLFLARCVEWRISELDPKTISGKS